MPKNIRLHELAKELGMTNKEALDLSVDLGIAVKSHSSSVEEAQADRVRRRAVRDGLTRSEQPPEPEKPKKAVAKKSGKTTSSDGKVEAEPVADAVVPVTTAEVAHPAGPPASSVLAASAAPPLSSTPVAVAVVSVVSGPLGVGLHLRLPARIEERVQALGRGRVDGVGSVRGLEEEEGAQQQSTGHASGEGLFHSGRPRGGEKH